MAVPKFRAWDKEHKIMLVVNNICNLSWESKFIEGYEVVPDPKGKREYELIDRRIDLEDAILMQTTGLFDINDVEIWEGDVVRFHTPQLTTIGGVVFDKNGKEIFEGDVVHAYGEDTYLIGVIEYFDNAYCIKSKNGIYNSLWTNAEQYEIIGNIYENTELVETENDTEI